MPRCEAHDTCTRPGRWRVEVRWHRDGIGYGAVTYHACGTHLHQLLRAQLRDVPAHIDRCDFMLREATHE